MIDLLSSRSQKQNAKTQINEIVRNFKTNTPVKSLQNFFIYGILFDNDATQAQERELSFVFKKAGMNALHHLPALLQAYMCYETTQHVDYRKFKAKWESGTISNVSETSPLPCAFLSPSMFGIYLQTPLEYLSTVYFKDHIFVTDFKTTDEISYYNDSDQQSWQQSKREKRKGILPKST